MAIQNKNGGGISLLVVYSKHHYEVKKESPAVCCMKTVVQSFPWQFTKGDDALSDLAANKFKFLQKEEKCDVLVSLYTCECA